MKELQPIRIPSGWVVSYNNWYECDPTDPESDEYLVEDLYQIFNENHDVLIDVGWYGSIESGTFGLISFKHDFHGKELAKCNSRNRHEILITLENWLQNPMQIKFPPDKT